MWRHSGTFHNDDCIDIVDLPSITIKQVDGVVEKDHATHIFPTVVVGGEVLSDIPEGGSPEQRIDHGVDKNVGVQMASKTEGIRNRNTS